MAAAKVAPAEERARALARAESLWRGPPLADFAYEAFAQTAIARLEELRLAVSRSGSTPISSSGATRSSWASSRGWCSSIRCASGCAGS